MRNRIVLAAALLATAPSFSHADPFWLYERNAGAPATLGQFYVSANAWGDVQQLPTFRSTFSLFSTSGVLPPGIDPDLVGAEPGGAIGYAFRDGSLPPWIGQRVRVELGGNIITMSSRDNRSFRANGETFVFNSVGGTPFFAPATIGFFRVDEELRVEREGFRLHLKFAVDRRARRAHHRFL